MRMKHHSHRLILFGLFCAAFMPAIALALGGCGPGGGSKYEEPIVSLIGGTNCDISRFNSTCIYSVISAQPVEKPESETLPSVIYPFTLSTTGAKTGSSRSIIPPGGGSGTTRSIPFPKQAAHDLEMRRVENELLARRVRQLSGRPMDRDRAIVVGTKWDGVYITKGEEQWVSINTTCLYVSEHAYFFADDQDIAAMGSSYFAQYFAQYGPAFDLIYQINHAKFGRENDVDGNSKVIIVFSRELTGGLLGYFYAGDKFARNAENPYSNQGDIFYITTDAEYQGGIVKATLAHEFQHMIYFDEHYNRGAIATYTWLNEALSQAAEYYNGYLENHHTWIASFLSGGWNGYPGYPYGLSLTHWTPFNYGYGAVFIRYLIDQYGDMAIKNMCATHKVGVAAVEAATGKKNFNLIFIEFTRALVMSGAVPSGDLYPRYRFTTLDLQAVQPDGRGGLTTPYSYQAGETIEGTLFPYEIRFLPVVGKIRQHGPLRGIDHRYGLRPQPLKTGQKKAEERYFLLSLQPGQNVS